MRHRRLPNGYARRHGCRPEDFDAAQLRRGTQVELEHTSDRKIAQQIALDHLCEDRDYYKKLAKIHLDSPQQNLGAAVCSTSPRWVRGGAGFLIGGLLGGMIGGGIALAITTTQFEFSEPGEAITRAKNMALLATGITIIGATGGLLVGSWKPEC